MVWNRTRVIGAVIAIAVVAAACASGFGVGSLTGVPKSFLDRMSGSTCLAQREEAVNLLGAWMDGQIGDGFDTVSAVQPPYLLIYAEDAKPDDQEDQALIGLAEGVIIGTVTKRLVDLAKTKAADANGQSEAQIALAAFNALSTYGFDLAVWRGKVAATSC